MDKAYRNLMAVGTIIQITSPFTFFCFGFFTSHYFLNGMQSTWELIVGIGSFVVSAILLIVFGILMHKYNNKH